jgi:hypothetical protein
MNTEAELALKGSLRTALATIPGLGGIAQAWSEVEGYVQSQRIEALSEYFTQRCRDLHYRLIELKDYIMTSGEIPILMERVCRKVLRETSETKRRMLAEAFVKSIAAGPEMPFDDKLTIIDTLDSLTESDLRVFHFFFETKLCQGIHLLDLSGVPRISNEEALAPDVSRLFVPLSKLEARALIAETAPLHIPFHSEGDASHWVNRFRAKTFALTPFGDQFISFLVNNM